MNRLTRSQVVSESPQEKMQYLSFSKAKMQKTYPVVLAPDVALYQVSRIFGLYWQPKTHPTTN